MDEKCGEVHKMLSKYFQFFLDENRLELNERFALVDNMGSPQYAGYKFWFNTQNGGKLVCESKEFLISDITMALFRGNLLIKKLPYKPKVWDGYFYVSAAKTIARTVHGGTTIDYMLSNAGKCYRTYEEAELHYDQDCNDLLGDEQ